jgi:hypothetical protein
LSDKAELQIVNKARGCQRDGKESRVRAGNAASIGIAFTLLRPAKGSLSMSLGEILIYHGEKDYPFFDVKTALIENIVRINPYR